MQVVKVLGDVNVLDASGAPAYRMAAREEYVLFDQEAGFALRDGAVRIIEGFDRRLAAYQGEELTDQRLLLPFIGRAGDAMAASACVQALRARYPDIRVDVACRPAVSEVFLLTTVFDLITAYPTPAESLTDYDYYLDFEPIEGVPLGARRSLFDAFSRCLHTPRPTSPACLHLSRDTRRRWMDLVGGRPLAGIQVGPRGVLRTYPHELTIRLGGHLLDDGWRIVLVGSDASGSMTHADCPAGVEDLIGKTPCLSDLAAVISCCDLFVTSDSLPMHLAGALGVRTLAVFTSTDAVLASDYACVTPLQSAASCSPCFEVGARCPLGHGHCVAHHDASVSPQSLGSLIGMMRGVRTTTASHVVWYPVS